MLPGCGALHTGERVLPPTNVRAVVQRATGVPLIDEPPADSPSMVNLLATYSGEDRRRAVTVLVFDGRKAITQAVGRSGDRAPDPTSIVVRDRNVLIFYRGDAVGRRLLRAGLAALPGVPEELVGRLPPN